MRKSLLSRYAKDSPSETKQNETTGRRGRRSFAAPEGEKFYLLEGNRGILSEPGELSRRPEGTKPSGEKSILFGKRGCHIAYSGT